MRYRANMRNRKLLFQIGIVVLLVFMIMMVAIQKYIIKRNTAVYLEAKNEMITEDMKYFSRIVTNQLYPELEAYWLANSDKINQEMTPRELDILDKLYDGKNVISPDDFLTLNEEEKLAHAKNLKAVAGYNLLFCMNTRGYSDAYLAIPIDEDNAFIVPSYAYDYSIEAYNTAYDTDAESATDPASITDTVTNNNYKFGDIISFENTEVKDFSSISANKDGEVVFADSINAANGNAYYTGFLGLYDNKDQPLGVLCCEYDWSDAYSSILNAATYSLITNMIIGLLIMAGVVLICLYLIAVKPLKETKEALDIYKVTKNSADVEERLAGFKNKNEIGQFADNVVELSIEIDRYNEENMKLAAKNAKAKTELDLAASIQRESLIKEFPESKVYEVAASMTPAKEVGGDFYDVFDIDDEHTAFVIADVSGKGMPAALFMMAAMNTIKDYSAPGEPPSEIISKVNDTLAKRKIMGMFVTVWLGVLDKKTGILTTSNAGHEYPAVNTTGRFELFKDTHGLVAGGYAGIKYKDHEIQLSKGDTVFVYTDGVPEATNADEKMFKDERMLDALNKNPSASPSELLETVKSAVDEFVGEAEQFDDLTMLCIKYNG